jgi:hypothetical protein
MSISSFRLIVTPTSPKTQQLIDENLAAVTVEGSNLTNLGIFKTNEKATLFAFTGKIVPELPSTKINLLANTLLPFIEAAGLTLIGPVIENPPGIASTLNLETV